MAQVEVVGVREDLPSALACLHRLGVLEIMPLAVPRPVEMPSIHPAIPERSAIVELDTAAGRLGSLLSLLAGIEPSGMNDAGGEQTGTADGDPVSATHDLLAKLEPVCAQLTARISALEAEQANLARYQDILERLLPLTDALVPLEGFETVALVIEPTHRFELDALREELSVITHQQCELVAAEAADGKIAALLIYSRRFAAAVNGLLRSEDLAEVRIPTDFQDRPLRTALEKVRARMAALPGELTAARQQIDDVLRPNLNRLNTVHAAVLDRRDELAVVSLCLESDYTFAVRGWVPASQLEAMERSLVRSFEGRLVVECVPFGDDEATHAPVLLVNPGFVRPFEVLLSLLPPPAYGSIDPTPLVAFFFPFFFGFILGDVGYGAVLLLAAVVIRWRRLGGLRIQQAAVVLGSAALSAIVFGALFGECFGSFGHQFGLRPLLVERAHAIQPLLVFSLGVGAAQVGIGLLLGATTAFTKHHAKEAVAKIATLAALAAVLAATATLAGFLPRPLMTPSLLLLAVATAALVYSVGLVGPLEVVGVLGNVLSYMRLVAVGLASAILANVANDLAGLTGSVLIGIAVAALFHGLNLGLGLISPSIQSLRLQYVEFFGRFFHPEGRPYRPFRSRLNGGALLET